MSDTTQWKNSRHGFLDGRIEKRLSMSVPVYLTVMTEPALVNVRLRKTSVPTVLARSAGGPGGLAMRCLLPT
jgi:hypothetical protein